MRPIRLASRYAKALFELAGEHNIRKEVFDDMVKMAEVCRTCKGFKRMLQSPLIKFDKKHAVIHAILGKHFHKATLAYTDIIIRKRREMILDEIAEQYIILYREWKRIKTVRVIAAIVPDPSILDKIRNMLAEQLQAEIEIETIVKPEMLGGFLLKVDGMQWDATIRRKITRLTRAFNINIYEKRL
jgi:F-type H+-transporting ATPase subunit delta